MEQFIFFPFQKSFLMKDVFQSLVFS